MISENNKYIGAGVPSSVPGLEQDLHTQFYSTIPFALGAAPQRQEMVFFQKNDTELTNMKLKSQMPASNAFAVIGLQARIFNLNGARFNYSAADASLRQFVNSAKVTLTIDSKPFTEMILSTLCPLPELAQDAVPATAAIGMIAASQQSAIYLLPKESQFTLQPSMYFNWLVTGVAGAEAAAFGFTNNNTVLQLIMFGRLVRPVQ